MSSDGKDPGSWQEPTGSPQKDADWTQPPDYVPAVDEEDIPAQSQQQNDQHHYSQQQAYHQQSKQAAMQAAPPMYKDEPEPATTPRALLTSLSQYLALIIFPLLFAGLTALIVLPRVANGQAALPSIGFWPVIVIIFAVMIAQGVVVYYAGSDNGLWVLGTVGGFCLFLLITCFSVYGLIAGILLLIALLAGAVTFARRSLHPVPEGYVDIVYVGEKYSRTLFAGFNILLPWEKVYTQLNVEEVQWISPPQVVQLSRDEDVRLRAVISYQLLQEDAYLALTQVRNWEESLRTLFQTVIQDAAATFNPNDFLVWPPDAQQQPGDDDFAGGFVRRDQINKQIQQVMSDKVALWGVQVNWVSIRDIELLPHGSAALLPTQAMVANQSPAAVAPKEQTQPMPVKEAAHVKVEATTGATHASHAASASIATPAESTTPALSNGGKVNEEVLINAYKTVQSGRITSPETIRRIAAEFDVIAHDPVLSQSVPFDAARAAQNLYEQARKYDEQILDDLYHDETHPDWLPRRASDENLTAGG
jgi:hypothetical protein